MGGGLFIVTIFLLQTVFFPSSLPHTPEIFYLYRDMTLCWHYAIMGVDIPSPGEYAGNSLIDMEYFERISAYKFSK